MSTNALIGIYRNGNVKFVYCHYDGYGEHVGYLLKKYYNTRKLVNGLIKLGDISVLGKYLHPKDGEWLVKRGGSYVQY